MKIFERKNSYLQDSSCMLYNESYILITEKLVNVFFQVPEPKLCEAHAKRAVER